MPRKQKPLRQKLADNVRVNGECLVWTKKKDRKGYGLVSVGRQKWAFAHRAAWFVAHGAWPDGVILHGCDNPACINVAHLSVGTHADNVRDAIQKGRLDNRGAGHGMSKLTDAMVQQIRALYTDGGVTQRELAHQFGISQAMVSMVCTHKNWRHLQ